LLWEAAVIGNSQGVLPADLRRRFDAVLDALAALSQPLAEPAIDVERLREAFWEANKNNVWVEAVDTTDRMADQVAAEYEKLSGDPR
jgi:uncharacterized membrane protein YccC